MAAPRRRWGPVVGALVALALGAALVVALLRAGSPPEGPVEVPLDAATCARCRMLVSDPSFAAQLHTRRGEVLFFDDPGCLLLHLGEDEARSGEPGHAAWVHHLRKDHWIPLERARFVSVPRSPMGYDLGATSEGDAPDGLTARAARERLEERAEAPEAGAAP